ncbi:AAEL006920-PA [Aedes aegypti]|uniref:AAEL006920-PA n=1 Tax=Aedes aegypti TaxID=7159 RepID=Q174E5_AEDAE|nr:AAEL006920-PA [Aedes aegypti]
MARKAYIFLCFLIINYTPTALSRALPNSRLRNEGVTSISPENFSDCFEFPNTRELIIDGLIHTHWNESAFAQLVGTKYLTLINGTIPMITFRSSKLSSLSVLHTKLEWFDVWPEKNPTLKTLQISRNRLQEVPSNIKYLVELTLLDLSQNELEYVDLQKLSSLTQLRTLDLSVNKIVLIDAEPQLRLNNLRNLDVSYNKLERFDAFPRTFPVLDTIRLIGNKWTCEWVDRARRNIMDRRIVTFGVDYGCNEHRQGGLCCYGDLVMGGTTEANGLKEGPLVQEISKLVNDLAENPMAAFGSDQMALELLTRNDGQDKILVGVKLDDVKVFLP